jgi:hypothetical protein
MPNLAVIETKWIKVYGAAVIFVGLWDGENRKIFVDLFMNTPDVFFDKISLSNVFKCNGYGPPKHTNG